MTQRRCVAGCVRDTPGAVATPLVVRTLPRSAGPARVRFVPRIAAPSVSLTRAEYSARVRDSHLAGYAPGRIKPPVRRTAATVVCTPAPVVPAGLLGADDAAAVLRMPVRVLRLLAVSEPELLPPFTLSASGEPCFTPAALEGWR